MKLNRRDLLKWLGLAPAAAVAAKVVEQGQGGYDGMATVLEPKLAEQPVVSPRPEDAVSIARAMRQSYEKPSVRTVDINVAWAEALFPTKQPIVKGLHVTLDENGYAKAWNGIGSIVGIAADDARNGLVWVHVGGRSSVDDERT